MSTCTIMLELPDNKMIGVDCYWDGYVDGVGKVLLENYTNRDKVEKLLQGGDINTLRDSIAETSYVDSGEFHPPRFIMQEELEMTFAPVFNYLYKLDNKWYVLFNFIEEDEPRWTPLSKALEACELAADEEEILSGETFDL